MKLPSISSSQPANGLEKLIRFLIVSVAVFSAQVPAENLVHAEDTPAMQPAAPPAAAESEVRQAEREAGFAKLLSGATLDGNFTMTDAGTTTGDNATKLNHDKYTLGEVKKLTGNQWQFAARIQYSEKDFTVPLTLPVEWAGDTPVIVVDNVGLPGLGTVSARVMFFADHYAGFWQHGTRTGHLFGVIRREAAK